MFHPAKLAAAILLLALAGCGTAPRPHPAGERPPDVDLIPPGPAVPTPPPPLPTPAPATNQTPTPTPAPKPPTFTVPAGTWVHLGRWAEANHLGPLTNLHSTIAPTFALTTSAGIFVLRAGSLLTEWAGLELRLGYAPQMIGGELFLHTLDVQKNLIPLLSATSPPSSEPRVIVIDPGHGGHDSGTRSAVPGKWEKEYTLDWARRLKPLLEAAGWEVYLTRTNDADASLPARVEFADAHHAAVFLSRHFNATTGPDQAGIETYCVTPLGMPSSVTRGYEDNSAMEFPNNKFDAPNLQFAVRLHRAVLIATGGQDRGVRRARFLAVLRGQNRPAVLIEGGYLSNPAEAKLINTPEHRQKLAAAVAKALQ